MPEVPPKKRYHFAQPDPELPLRAEVVRVPYTHSYVVLRRFYPGGQVKNLVVTTGVTYAQACGVSLEFTSLKPHQRQKHNKHLSLPNG